MPLCHQKKRKWAAQLTGRAKGHLVFPALGQPSLHSVGRVLSWKSSSECLSQDKGSQELSQAGRVYFSSMKSVFKVDPMVELTEDSMVLSLSPEGCL
jgi:hypothetical protein